MPLYLENSGLQSDTPKQPTGEFRHQAARISPVYGDTDVLGKLRAVVIDHFEFLVPSLLFRSRNPSLKSA